MELQVEFAKNYCSTAKEPQLCLSPKNGNGDLVNRWWERVCEFRLGTDVCLQKCTENPENISSCRSCSCNKENGLLKQYVCRVMIGVAGWEDAYGAPAFRCVRSNPKLYCCNAGAQSRSSDIAWSSVRVFL